MPLMWKELLGNCFESTFPSSKTILAIADASLLEPFCIRVSLSILQPFEEYSQSATKIGARTASFLSQQLTSTTMEMKSQQTPNVIRLEIFAHD